MLAKLDELLEWTAQPRQQTGLKVARVSFGLIILFIYTINFSQRHFLLGADGLYQNVSRFNLFAIPDVPLDLLYGLAIIVALLFAVGIGGRFVALCNLLFFWSWTNGAAIVGDGGDNVLRIILAYMLFCDLTGSLPAKPTTIWQRLGSILHNAGLVAIVLQLSTLYLTSGLMKIRGEMWQDGTALYYILQVREFSNPKVAGLLLQFPHLLTAATYATCLFQIAFPWLLLNPVTKRIGILISMSFHLGILVAMNLVSFSAIMITMELILVTNVEYSHLVALGQRVFVKLRAITSVWRRANA